MPKRGPTCKLGYDRVFHLILWMLQQFPLMTCESYTTYVGGRLAEHFDHPFLSFEATCTIRTDTIPGGKQVHFAVQA